jgi:hypothetical protein
MKTPKRIDSNDVIMVTKKALADHAKRQVNRALREICGTDDPEKIKADLAELSVHREAARQRARADDAEKKFQQAIDLQTFAEYDRDATSILKQHVAPKFVKTVLRSLKEHVVTLDDRELSKPKKAFESFAKKFVRKYPELARARAKKARAR